MIHSDIFVIHDDSQFIDSDFIHRNRIRIPNGWKWLTVPVIKEKSAINTIMINNDTPKNSSLWSKVHLREIDANYKKTPYYDVYADKLKEIYLKKYDKLIDINMKIITFLADAFDIDLEIKFSSELGLESHSSEKIVDIVHGLGGDVYLSGPGGHNYLNESLFKDIKLRYQNYKHPVYEQRYPGFIENMSAIDALFNVGGMPR